MRWAVAGVGILVALLVVVWWRAGDAPVRGASASARTHTPAPALPASDAGDAAGALRLGGVVLDETEQPIPGAHVHLGDHETVSAGDGSFELAGLAPGDYELSASGEDLYAEREAVVISDGTAPVVIYLHPAATLTLHVVDAERHVPIAGAKMYGEPQVTDEHGEVHIHGLTPERHTITVDAPGYEPREITVDLSPRWADATIDLQRGAPVSGRAVDPDGAPLAEAVVFVAGRGTRYSAQVDASGNWRVDALAAGPHAFRLADQPPTTADLVLELDGTTAREGIVLRGMPRRVLAGIVVDEAGTPVGGADLAVRNGQVSWTEKVDPAGRFHLPIRDPGSAEVWARDRTRASPITKLELAPGAHGEVRLVVAPSSIAGTVVDTHRQPVAGATIVAWSKASGNDLVATSNGDGRFELGGTSGRYTLTVLRPGEAEPGTRSQRTDVASGSHGTELVLPDVGTIRGRVVLDGVPVVSFGIDVVDRLDPRVSPRPIHAPDGRFTMRDVEVGTHTVVIAGRGFARKTLEGIALRDGEQLDLGDIVVDRGRVVHGRVTDATGASVAGAAVTVHDHEGGGDAQRRAIEGTGMAITDASGFFTIQGLAPPLGGASSARHIVASHPARGTSIELPLGDGETEVNLVIEPAGGIDGRIVGLEGASAASTGIDCRRVDDRTFSMMTSIRGLDEFRYDNLAPGRYRLRLYAPTPAITFVDVVAGQRARVEIAIPPERIDLAVHVRGHCSLIALETDDAFASTLTTAECTGPSTLLRGVSPGAYRVCNGWGAGCTPITVAPTPPQQTIELP